MKQVLAFIIALAIGFGGGFFVAKAMDNPGFGEILINSVNLARAAGVEESELLRTTQDIDDYFT